MQISASPVLESSQAKRHVRFVVISSRLCRPCRTPSGSYTSAWRSFTIKRQHQEHMGYTDTCREPHRPWCRKPGCRWVLNAQSLSGAGDVPSVNFTNTAQQVTNNLSWLLTLSPLWIASAAALAVLQPSWFLWITPEHTQAAVALAVLSTGLTMRVDSLWSSLQHKWPLVVLSLALQYTIMPAIGCAVCWGWGLTSGLMLGTVLLSLCPGSYKPVILTYMARGDVPLSVVITVIGMLCTVMVSPLLCRLLLGHVVALEPISTVLSTLQLILVPCLIGAASNQVFPEAAKKVSRYTNWLCAAAMTLIICNTLALNSDVALLAGPRLITAMATLTAVGFGVGYWVCKRMGLSESLCRTEALQVGNQSPVLAAVLAVTYFSDPIVVVPIAVAACSQPLIGSVLAAWWRDSSQDQGEGLKAAG